MNSMITSNINFAFCLQYNQCRLYFVNGQYASGHVSSVQSPWHERCNVLLCIIDILDFLDVN